jgi:hypothetical protein
MRNNIAIPDFAHVFWNNSRFFQIYLNHVNVIFFRKKSCSESVAAGWDEFPSPRWSLYETRIRWETVSVTNEKKQKEKKNKKSLFKETALDGVAHVTHHVLDTWEGDCDAKFPRSMQVSWHETRKKMLFLAIIFYKKKTKRKKTKEK